MTKSTTEDTPLVAQDRPKPNAVRVAALMLIIVAVQVAAVLWSLDTVGSSSLEAIALSNSDSIKCGVARSEAGYIPLANRNNASHYFYWYFESRSRPESDPLVVWLTGGPGCSSLMALLTENGPCTVTAGGTGTKLNPFSWNAHANVIWLDQPSNVGVSFASADARPDENEEDVADNLLSFLRGFVAKHPELRGRELFLTGESYAGHYVPAAAHRIWRDSMSDSSEKLKLNLTGVAIGNGITDPVLQTQHQLDMVDNAYNITLMSPEDYTKAKALQPNCTKQLKEAIARRDFDSLSSECENVLLQPFHKSRVNPHDIRMPCIGGGDCYDMADVAAYLNSEAVRRYLNISSPKVWEECSSSLGHRFMDSGDFWLSYASQLGELLDGDVRVLLYAGDADTVCNWYSVRALAKSLSWRHQREFLDAKEHSFRTANGSVESGRALSFENRLTFLRLLNAGHMAPRDQPAVALEMIDAFLRGEIF